MKRLIMRRIFLVLTNHFTDLKTFAGQSPILTLQNYYIYFAHANF